MSITYTPTTNFGSKDSLPSNDPNKVIKGAEFTTEFTAIQSAFGLAAPSSNPTFTGTATFDSVTANAVSLGDVTTSNLTVSGAFTSLGIDDNATSTAITIDSSENVGIGTDSPDGTLHVKDTIAQLYVQSNDGQPSQVVFGDVTDASGGMIEYTSTDAMAFKTNNLNERMRIDASGNVGIGTATPVSTNNYGGLTLNGASGGALSFTDDDVLVGNLLSSGSDMYFGTGGDTVFRNGGYTGSDEAMRIDSSGNVGINTTNPSIYGGLVIAQDANTSSDGFAVVDSTLAQSAKLWCDGTNSYLSSGNTGNDPLILNTGGGNVGIGNTNPSRTLDIGDGTSSAHVGIRASSSPNILFTSGGANVGYIGTTLWNTGAGSDTELSVRSENDLTFTSGSTERMRIDSSGNVGIGTSDPQQALHVAGGGLQIEGNISAPAAGTESALIDYFNNNMRFWSRGTSSTRGTFEFVQVENDGQNQQSPMVIDASGQVGIGMTAPSDRNLSLYGATNCILSMHNSTSGTTAASGVQLQGVGNNGYMVNYNTGGALAFFTAETGNNTQERMRLDASGHLGIKTTPSPWRTTDGVIELGQRSSLAGLSIDTHLSTNAYFSQASGWKAIDTAAATNYYQNDGSHVWRRAATTTAGASVPWVESMRIDSSGNLLVGTDVGTGPRLRVERGGIVAEFNRSSGTSALISFQYGGVDAGYITSSAGGTPSFTAASDERLKDNIVDHESELANVMSLRPTRWDWKEDAKGSGEGFIAQELEATAWADLVSEGDDGFKQVSGLGAVETRLIKAMQEQQAMIEALKAKVEALENA